MDRFPHPAWLVGPLAIAALVAVRAQEPVYRAAVRTVPVYATVIDPDGRLVTDLDRDAFRAMAARVRERTGQKGRALFHPIRIVLTGEAEGIELDIAVPAIERGASLERAGVGVIPGARTRAHEFAAALAR